MPTKYLKIIKYLLKSETIFFRVKGMMMRYIIIEYFQIIKWLKKNCFSRIKLFEVERLKKLHFLVTFILIEF